MTVPATIVRIIDGDTLVAAADLGWHLTLELTVRLADVNAIELARPGGREAAQHLAALTPPGSAVTLVSLGLDKYGGRTDGRIIRPDGVDVAARMVADGYAAPWDGRGPRPTPPWPIPEPGVEPTTHPMSGRPPR